MRQAGLPGRLLAWSSLAVLSAGCTLTEITLADPQDIVVAEVVLRTDGVKQRAFLYRTLGTGQSGEVSGARVEIHDEAGGVMVLAETATRQCIDELVMGPLTGSCYVEASGPVEIEPGASYTLRITLRDGGVLTGSTTVPGDFVLTSPAAAACNLGAGRTLELRWTPSDEAWVYVAEAGMRGLANALAAQGIELSDDPVRLLGLAITREDTTITFPTGFGLFDRATPEVAEALLAIRDGLPAGVVSEVTVAAADRNYVNWVRGGNFNPSGLVRVPSVSGAGTGVFGSVVPKSRLLTTVAADPAPPCD